MSIPNYCVDEMANAIAETLKLSQNELATVHDTLNRWWGMRYAMVIGRADIEAALELNNWAPLNEDEIGCVLEQLELIDTEEPKRALDLVALAIRNLAFNRTNPSEIDPDIPQFAYHPKFVDFEKANRAALKKLHAEWLGVLRKEDTEPGYSYESLAKNMFGQTRTAGMQRRSEPRRIAAQAKPRKGSSRRRNRVPSS